MGGVCSGRVGNRGGKKALEDFPSASLVYSGRFSLKQRSGAYVRVEADDFGVIVCGSKEFFVAIESTPLHLGGARRWLVCNECGARRQALYIANNKAACRKCLGLRYESQFEDRRARIIRRADRIRARLGWVPGVLNPDGTKPPRMHVSTYLRLTAELNALVEALVGNMTKWLALADKMLERRSKR